MLTCVNFIFRWQVGVGISYSGHFSQVSFVNSICTSKGGTHVNYIADQVVKYIMEQLKSKDKDLRLKETHLKVIFFHSEKNKNTQFFNYFSL